MTPKAPQHGRNVAGFPQSGTAWETLKQEMLEFKELDHDWRGGRLPAYIYYFNDELVRVSSEAYSLYSVENALGEGKVFKSLTRMLDDISTMAFDLYNAPESAGMSFTSGGTEGLFEVVKTARKWHRTHRKSSGTLNVVAPVTAHAALDKAGEILDVEIIRTPLGPEYRGDTAAMADAITDDTILLFGSAPCFPYGVFDPTAELGRLALERDLWFHVDACWGGFVSPFAKQLGYPIPDWDFSVPGVTSISTDIHKFGFSAKGASLLIFRDVALKEYERFEFSGWPRGTYATPTFMGSRPAGAIASAWAVMRHLGFEGYLETTKAAMDATMGFIEGIDAIEGLRCLRPIGETNVYNFVSDDPGVDIMAVADVLQENGWFPGRMREPLAIQQGVNPVHLPIVDEYVRDVAAAVDYVRANKQAGTYREDSY